jgi:hypothetical protein
MLVGCGSAPELNTEYGRREAGWKPASINGTGLLARMYRDAGCSVSSWTRLSRKLARCDTIVWFPRAGEVPTLDQLNFFEDWLSASEYRTLVFVGPGHDSAVEYWRLVAGQLSGPQAVEAQRRLNAARLTRHDERWPKLASSTCTWFELAGLGERYLGKELSGPWVEQGLVGQPHLERSTKLAWHADDSVESDRYEVLLSVDQAPFVWRYQPSHWGGSQLIVVNNGSFLLNYPLTQTAHQQLARQLVEHTQYGGRVIFLETAEGGPAIVESQDLPLSGLVALADWPLGPVLVQWLMVGVIFSLAAFPIWGRARTPSEPHPSDFGEHISALAELLSRTGDVEFARQRVQQFRQQIGRTELDMQSGNPFRSGAGEHRAIRGPDTTEPTDTFSARKESSA